MSYAIMWKTGELRNLTTANGEDGGYSVIPQLDKDVMKRLTDDSVMRQLCNVVRLPVGAKEYKKLVSGWRRSSRTRNRRYSTQRKQARNFMK